MVNAAVMYPLKMPRQIQRDRWIVEEWIFALALLKERRATFYIIIDKIRQIRRNGLDWDVWIQEERRWIEGPPR